VRFCFENLVLDADRRELLRDGAPVAVEPQVFDLLLYLVENRARVVSKDDVLNAVWHGRIVSESTLTTRINAARKALGDSGDVQRLIRTVPRKGFRFVGEVQDDPAANPRESAGPGPGPGPTLALPDRPSIAVLPFQSLSGDPDQDYFADGIVEDLITALSRFKSLFVIARNSSFTYKGKAVDIKQVGRELGVRYILEGSVRKLGDRLRVTAQLIETATGSHLWAEKYDRDWSDLFAIQDEMTESVVASIEPQLMIAEERLSRSRQTTDLDAWALLARSFGRGAVWTRENLEEALKLVGRALQRDPSFARALAEAARLHGIRAYSGWSSDKAAEYAKALQFAHAAVRHDPAEPWGYFARGWVLCFLHQYQDAVLDLSKAVELNASFAVAHARLGAALAYIGQPREGIGHTQRALRMSPRDPLLFNFLLMHALVLFVAGRYGEAADAARQSVQAAPGFPNALRVFAASAAFAGRVPEAQEALTELKQVQPEISLTWIRRNADMPAPAIERFLDALALAGLSE
jgi:TolB-like protein